MAQNINIARGKVEENLEIASGSTLDINGTWNISGTAVTVSASEINALASTGLNSTELGYLDSVTAGTVKASKAAVVDSSKDIGDFRNLDAVNIDLGASGTAGTLDIFPATATSGKWTLSCTAQTGDTTVTTNVAAMGQATTITIPDPGAATASVLLTAGTQTLAEGKNINTGTGTGTILANGTSQKLAFWAATPVVQQASANQATAGAMTLAGGNTGTSGTGLNLFSETWDATAAAYVMNDFKALQEDVGALSTLLESVRTALVNTGIIKGSA